MSDAGNNVGNNAGRGPAPEALPDDIRDALAEGLAPAYPTPTAAHAMKQRLLARVRAEQAAQGGADGDAVTAAPLCEPGAEGWTTVRAGEGEWRPFLPKVQIKVLRREEDILTYLLKLEPGAAVVPHDHPVDEECLVLEGEARIGELVVRAGDYHLAPRGKPHGMITSEHGALLFLRGAVPHASQVRWLSRDAVLALAPEALRRFIARW